MNAVRADWMHIVCQELQCVAGRIAFHEHDGGGAFAARELISRIPEPVTPIEDQLLRGMLTDVSVRWAANAHRRAHGGAKVSCGFREDVHTHYAWAVEGGACPSAKAAFEEWAAGYFRALRRVHPVPIEQAAEWIVEHSRGRVDDRLVARAVGVHVVVLRREFKSAYGVSVHAYLQRARLADAIRLLSDHSHDVRSALYGAGWRSPKSLYNAAVRVTGQSVAELRHCPHDQRERCTALPRRRMHSRQDVAWPAIARPS